MKTNKVIIALIFFFVASGAVYLLANTTSSETEAVVNSDNSPAPDFTLQDINGNEVQLSDLKGKVVALNFWATWCGPCRKEIPDFIELQNMYGKDGLQFVGIALDEGGVGVVKPYADKMKINYPILIGTEAVTVSYGGMNAIPVTILIDKMGNLRGKFVGMRTKAVMESLILPLLKEK
jgi:cytochrome c biogenesis protein CcmG/thiol:disulfide interchange protein DsbE